MLDIINIIISIRRLQMYPYQFTTSQLLHDQQPEAQQNVHFYNQLVKLQQSSREMRIQYLQLVATAGILIHRLDDCEKRLDQGNVGELDRAEPQQKPRRFRRTNSMIEKMFSCFHDKCDKVYATEGSLLQHIKLKHKNTTALEPAPKFKSASWLPTKRIIEENSEQLLKCREISDQQHELEHRDESIMQAFMKSNRNSSPKNSHLQQG